MTGQFLTASDVAELASVRLGGRRGIRFDLSDVESFEDERRTDPVSY